MILYFLLNLNGVHHDKRWERKLRYDLTDTSVRKVFTPVGDIYQGKLPHLLVEFLSEEELSFNLSDPKKFNQFHGSSMKSVRRT